jgi:hypothetical protein
MSLFGKKEEHASGTKASVSNSPWLELSSHCPNPRFTPRLTAGDNVFYF